MNSTGSPRVLILGAGINGCAVARELALNGAAVCMVEAHDIAAGATARSSRLIHGGLRYLEYGDFQLVRESLVERNRLLALAPQFVQPLRLFIPLRGRASGVLRSALAFCGASRTSVGQWLAKNGPGTRERGLWLVSLGLGLYDLFARGGGQPPHSVHRLGERGVPRVDAQRYRWLTAYTDAQMLYPERFVLALLDDARQLAQEQGTAFELFTRRRAVFTGRRVEVLPFNQAAAAGYAFEPEVVVNATGAWGDLTLQELGVSALRLFGGTRGSHFITRHAGLMAALGDAGIYAEAADGRLVFILPFGDAVLVGTTDEEFQERPECAVATPAELDYLIGMVNDVFGGLSLTRGDVALHYSGVRPLPFVPGGSAAAITRGHAIVRHECGAAPVFTLVGGKLTTCRAFAEQVADRVLEVLHLPRTGSSRERPIPGAPTGDFALRARRLGLSEPMQAAVWSLCGDRLDDIFATPVQAAGAVLWGTQIPLEFVRWSIRREWVASLEDLVERRLMLVYHEELSDGVLRQLAEELCAAGLLTADQVAAAVAQEIERLARIYGKVVMRSDVGSAGGT